MKRIILSGGGTGGHIYPAITIAREIEKTENVEILFVGTPNGMEAEIVSKEGYNFAPIPVSGLKRKFSFDNIKTLTTAAGSLFKARKILNQFKPDVVIGTGGYVCGPILMAAALSHIPTLIQEQNVIPGITNKILSHMVSCIALGYKEAASRFPYPGKCVYTGNPIRPSIIKAQRAESRLKLGIPTSDFMVLVTGGSRGAKTINQAMIGVHKYFKNKSGVHIHHVTGHLAYDAIIKELGEVKEGAYGEGSHIIEYEYDMPSA